MGQLVMAAYEDEIESAALHFGAGELAKRLSPEVAEIVRLDLIQTVGNALRYHARTTQENLDLEAFAEQESNKAQSWATW